MKVEINGKDRYVLFSDKVKRAWLSPKQEIEGFREVSLEELDKLLPHEGHKWHVTQLGGITWRTPEELIALRAEQDAKQKASAERRVKREATNEKEHDKEVAKGAIDDFKAKLLNKELPDVVEEIVRANVTRATAVLSEL